jgi:hypothetical protein
LKVRFLLPAQHELQEAVRYYNAQRPRLGDAFRDEARETLGRIIKFPRLGIRCMGPSGAARCSAFLTG